ncbi:glycosyltransferase family 2 protein [Spirosoma oryzicola]|uniref:glycosyltransferase family 2 protein n=1 Tax=Spirosoma oryzicola TaxID=2898794 RepID=UPI001E4472C9|nr:glycosyltransferase family 2 protein [Spirosoma oryzicola]UHG91714.1 glycosyltransferase [Spirosoma oryzicola]
MSRPHFTIITVVYNTQSTLEATIISVLQQKKGLYEYWIIDGNSTDGSIDIIRKYEKELTGWVSEPDNGIYDAMNKGINRANGNWLYFLGADDTLENNVLEKIVPYLSNDDSMIFGNILFDNGRLVRSFLNLRTFLQNTVHHQGAFYNRKLFKDFRYDTSQKILSDYELNLIVHKNKLPVREIPVVIAICKEGGASSHLDKSLEETNLIRSKHVTNIFLRKTLSFSLWLYYSQKKIRNYLFK